MSKITQTAQAYWSKRSEIFSNYYKKPSLFDKIFRKGIYQRIAIAISVCREIPNASVLDIGSGPGLNSISLIKNANAAYVTGIDFAQEMIDSAKQTVKSEGLANRCNFILGDGITYDFSNNKFDFSMALGVFDYVKDAEVLIRRMCELTSKVLVISWPENGLRMWLRRKRYTCPLYHYTIEKIIELHNKALIKEEEIKILKIGGGWVTIAKK